MSPRPGAVLRVVRGSSPPAKASISDADIIEAFANGDRRAAALVYDRLLGIVDSTLFRVVGRRESDHDDLIQASFEQIILTLSRRSFAGGCSLTGWAASIACHVGLNAIRSRTRARRVFAPQPDGLDADEVSAEPTGTHDVEAQVDARREIDRVRRHLADMDPSRAKTVMLHDVFAVSLAETARLTGVSMAAAQSRLVRGRRELRERMAQARAEAQTDARMDEKGDGS